MAEPRVWPWLYSGTILGQHVSFVLQELQFETSQKQSSCSPDVQLLFYTHRAAQVQIKPKLRDLTQALRPLTLEQFFWILPNKKGLVNTG